MTTSIPVIIGHQDILSQYVRSEPSCKRDFLTRSTSGHLDLPRAQAGGIVGSFFAVYLPPDPAQPLLCREEQITYTANGYQMRLADPLEYSYALATSMSMVAQLLRLETQSQGQIQVVRTVDDLHTSLRNGTHAAILHFEGAEAIDPNLDALEVFYQAGLRSLGPVWSRPTIFGHGVPFAYPVSPDTGPGLTELGKELVKACNRLGIMLDLSHLNEQGFWDVVHLSDAPLVATHSNAHALCPTTRNLTDKQLAAIKASEGLVGLNFGVNDLWPDGQRNAALPLEIMVQQIDYLVDHLGIDGVAFGADFDGTTIPSALGDAAGMPVLLDLLRAHGYDEASLRKIGYENWLRVLTRTWK